MPNFLGLAFIVVEISTFKTDRQIDVAQLTPLGILNKNIYVYSMESTTLSPVCYILQNIVIIPFLQGITPNSAIGTTIKWLRTKLRQKVLARQHSPSPLSYPSFPSYSPVRYPFIVCSPPSLHPNCNDFCKSLPHSVFLLPLAHTLCLPSSSY